jgi:hypothetical protein
MGTNGNTMPAFDAKPFGPGYRRGKSVFPKDFNNFCRALGNAEPVPQTFLLINFKKRHVSSFLPALVQNCPDLDKLVKSQKCPRIVIPVKTGIQRF